MAQTTFDDDELFGEAADETRSEVQNGLDAARAQLPTADAVWETDADNVLGVLNGLSQALDTGDAAAELRDAKKAYVLGERAGAFDGDEELAAEMERVEDLIATLEEAREEVSDLTATIPELRSQLEEAHEGGPDADADSESDEAEAD